MVQREDVHYFGAGPAPLPTDILQAAGQALLNYNGMGIGIAEMSHRSPEATAVLQDTKLALKQFMKIPDDYDILFTQAGGSGQFSEVVYYMVAVWVQRTIDACEKLWATTSFKDNADSEKFAEIQKVVKAGLRLDYLVTGSWSLKASQEAARLVGKEHVHIVTDARESNEGKFGLIPPEDQWKLERPSQFEAGAKPQQSAFTYYCDNETVDGVEFPGFPASLEALSPDDDRLVVADMSSNILSRQVDVSKYAAIFAGAQKNVATPGVTLIIVRKSLLEQKPASADMLRALQLPIGPVALDWGTIAKNNSLYNTLPIFDVWIAGQVISQLLAKHGAQKIAGQEAVANSKASKIYQVLEKHSAVYAIVPEKHARSRMNICFRMVPAWTQEEEKLLKQAKEQGLTGIKGHRSVGGLRVSNCMSRPQACRLFGSR